MTVKNSRAYYLPKHPYSFRRGQPAEIIEVRIVTPSNGESRPCYKLKWPDGMIDYSPIYGEESSEVFEIHRKKDLP